MFSGVAGAARESLVVTLHGCVSLFTHSRWICLCKFHVSFQQKKERGKRTEIKLQKGQKGSGKFQCLRNSVHKSCEDSKRQQFIL